MMGGGFMGVGASEMVVIIAVGWLVLGPQKLFALSRDIGRLVGDLRKSADEARASFTSALEVDMNMNAKNGDEKSLSSLLDKTTATDAGNVGTATKKDTEESGAGPFGELAASQGEKAGAAGLAGAIGAPAKDASLPDVEGFVGPPTGRYQEVVDREGFLRQLNSSKDPLQRPPSAPDDFDVEDEKDVEAARLEYERKKARLEAKREYEARIRQEEEEEAKHRKLIEREMDHTIAKREMDQAQDERDDLQAGKGVASVQGTAAVPVTEHASGSTTVTPAEHAAPPTAASSAATATGAVSDGKPAPFDVDSAQTRADSTAARAPSGSKDNAA